MLILQIIVIYLERVIRRGILGIIMGALLSCCCGGEEGEGGPDGERTRLLSECGNSQIQVGHLGF